MATEEELIADVIEILEELVADGSLELATRTGSLALAPPLALLLLESNQEGAEDANLEEWLLDRDEVSELYLSGAELRKRMRPILLRLARGDEEPKWNDDLAAAIQSNPDDENARLVFGDWLQQEGDPRGELVAVQARLAQANKRTKVAAALRRREASLLARFRKHFFGDVAHDETACEVKFLCGFFDEARVEGMLVESLLNLHSARFLRVLEVTNEVRAASDALAKKKAKLPKTLARLKIGKSRVERGTFTVSDALLGLERLDVLEIHCPTVVIERIDLARLRELRFCSEVVRLPTMHEDAPLQMPMLTTLDLDAARIEGADRLLYVFAQPPKTLTHLRLPRTQTGELVKALVHSSLLPQLRSLDLTNTDLSAGDVALVLAKKEAFQHLERLDLSGLRPADRVTQDELFAICPNVVLVRLYPPQR